MNEKLFELLNKIIYREQLLKMSLNLPKILIFHKIFGKKSHLFVSAIFRMETELAFINL